MPKSAIDLLLPRLKRLRVKHGLTQEDFSERSGISYKYYQAVEGGRKRDLRLSTLERIAAAYGIGVHELLAPGEPVTRAPAKAEAAKKRSAVAV